MSDTVKVFMLMAFMLPQHVGRLPVEERAGRRSL